MVLQNVIGISSVSFASRSVTQGHSQLWDRTDLDTTLASLKSVYINPKSNLWRSHEHHTNARVEYIAKSTSIFPSVLFDL